MAFAIVKHKNDAIFRIPFRNLIQVRQKYSLVDCISIGVKYLATKRIHTAKNCAFSMVIDGCNFSSFTYLGPDSRKLRVKFDECLIFKKQNSLTKVCNMKIQFFLNASRRQSSALSSLCFGTVKVILFLIRISLTHSSEIFCLYFASNQRWSSLQVQLL